MKTSELLFGCADCYEERSYPADELAWYKGQLFCEDCWAWRLYLAEEDAGLPAYEDLEPFVPEYEKEIIRLRTELKTCKSFHTVAVKERDAERRETDRLRAELERLKRQWAEDDRDITALEDENNRLRAELEAEKEKKELAEEQVELDEKILDYRDTQVFKLESQVEALRRSLENISNLKIDPTSPEIFYHHVTDLTSLALANLPVRAAAVEKVLEAAEEQARLGAETHCDNHSVYFAACADTNKAVREWRKK
jgi:chromosome segregation ATPase